MRSLAEKESAKVTSCVGSSVVRLSESQRTPIARVFAAESTHCLEFLTEGVVINTGFST